MTTYITPGLVALDVDLGADKTDVIRNLAERVVSQGRATDAAGLAADALAREEQGATGVPGGIAIPHCRSGAVTEATLAMSRLNPGVDFGAHDGPSDLVFFIAAPDGAHDEHLQMLSKLARSLMVPEFNDSLRAATTPEEIVAIVEKALQPEEAKPAAAAAPAAPAASGASTGPVIVAVTSCATGIAHTFMSADALTAKAKEMGIEFYVEPQGSSKVTPLDPAIIKRADAVIFANDVDVRDRGRFAGKPVVQSPVKRGIDHPDELLGEAVAAAKDPNAKRVPAADSSEASENNANESVGARIKRWLLTGVSYMIPFVAGGGLLIALGFLLGGYDIVSDGRNTDIILQNSLFNLPPDEATRSGLLVYLGAVASAIGQASMGFLVPALAGYIAYAIADRPGIAPGFVAGAVAGIMGAGFIGGIVGGLIAGGAAYWIGSWNVPRWMRGLMPVVIIPLVGSIIASGLMVILLGGPIAALTNGLNTWLTGLTGASAVLLGIILGTMMCFDLGGPVNKVAYAFAVAGLGAGSFDNQAPWMIMATVMAAGMVPPLAMALATTIAPRLFSPVEKENGRAAWLLGAAFISEGAIPFAAADPLRVIPASILGGAATGAITMATGVTSQAPHGGIFVFFAIGNLLWFVLAILIGTVISGLTVIALKKWVRKAPVDADVPVAASLQGELAH
jgi:PTS system fructose-specific IIC component